jgi:very-short-patch-repair endonuclease
VGSTVRLGRRFPMRRLKPVTTDRAREMRRDPPLAERLLWQQLRLLKHHGFHLTRQLPVGSYFLDFACRRQKLAIELDGGQHAEQVDHDRARTAWLEANDWRVLRIWNADILADPARAAEAVLAVLRGAASLADVQAPHPAIHEPSRAVDPTLSLP